MWTFSVSREAWSGAGAGLWHREAPEGQSWPERLSLD